ncbi:MAG: hypothetical protein EP329_06200 [Deltaproteobacteria bacterium]|nr:MAG: hypothetical protein EP329_06200 [Deltaproteobacteria bacterium]
MKLAKSLFGALSAAAVLVLLAAPASAKKCEDVTMPNTVEVDGVKLVLNGMGIREATVFNVNVYIAGLYVEEKSTSAQAILDAEGPRRLVLRFVRDVDREDIVDAFSEGFGHAKNAGALMPRVQRLLAMMKDAKDGVSWTFTYTPANGLEVKLGGAVKGTIEGADFTKAFLNIWIGSKPPNKGLKTGLLGGKCG